MDSGQCQQRFVSHYTWSMPAAPEPDMSRTLRTYGGSSIGRGTSSYSRSSDNSWQSATPGQLVPAANTGYIGHANVQHLYPKSTEYMQEPVLNTSHYINGDEGIFEEQAEFSRPTAKSLGWTPNTRYGELYRVVVVDRKVSHLELLPEYQPNTETPLAVYLDTVKSSKGYACQYPGGCDGKQTTFARPADLDRHYIHHHAASSEREKFFCGYRKCHRAKEPFHRKDHYRDHLRDFHKEDLPGKRFRDAEAKRKWQEERKIDLSCWRCTRCLEKVAIGKDLFVCRTCTLPCESDRVASRQPVLGRTSQRDSGNPQNGISRDSTFSMSNSNQGYTGYAESCQNCQNTHYIQDYSGNTIECMVCRPAAYTNISLDIGSWDTYNCC